MRTTVKINNLWSVLALGLVAVCAEATYPLEAHSGTDPRFSRQIPSAPLPAMQQVQHTSSDDPDISVTCSASDLVVRVKPSFHGRFADKEALRLGANCESNGVLRPYGDLLFTYPLTACGAVRQSTSHHVAYKFVLHYKPPLAWNSPRLDVDIECRYPRKYHVSKLIVQPTWKTAVMHKRLKGLLNNFHIELMDESWSQHVKSPVFQLGSQIHFQVSALYLPHGAKTYISSCVAAPANDPESSQKYSFIDNSGCLLDSRSPLSVSQFISQTDNTVRFSLTAFQFVDQPDVALEVQCRLLVTTEDPSPAHKSCTYRGDRWEALSGNHSICDCCDSQCVIPKQRRDLIKGSATSQLLTVSDQPSRKEEDVPARISTSSSVTSYGRFTPSHYTEDLQSHDNQGWQTVDLYETEDHSGRRIRSNRDLDEQDESVTKAVLFKDAKSGDSFDVISREEREDLDRIEDGNDDASQPKQVQTQNDTEKSLTEFMQFQQVTERSEHGEQRRNSEEQLGDDKELGRGGSMTWFFW